jgi:hypothetical protein
LSTPPTDDFPLQAVTPPTLMQCIDDGRRFDISRQGQSIASIEWHDGLKARAEPRKCLAREPFDNKRCWPQ